MCASPSARSISPRSRRCCASARASRAASSRRSKTRSSRTRLFETRDPRLEIAKSGCRLTLVTIDEVGDRRETGAHVFAETVHLCSHAVHVFAHRVHIFAKAIHVGTKAIHVG